MRTSWLLTVAVSLAAASCAPPARVAPAAPVPSPRPAQPAPASAAGCSDHLQCGWGRRCEGDLDVLQAHRGVCKEAACHVARDGLAARECAAPRQCAYEDGYAINNGLGFCD